jgi:hypothetical protein
MTSPKTTPPGPVADQSVIGQHERLAEKLGGVEPVVGTADTPVWEANGADSVVFQRKIADLANVRHSLLIVPDAADRSSGAGQSSPTDRTV